MTATLWLAFVTGLLGSLHCAGMCGPIAFSLPFGENKAPIIFYAGRALYNLGRIVTYGLLGALVGTFGSALGMVGWQRYLGIIAGALLVLAVVFSYAGNKSRYSLVDKVSSKVKAGFNRYFGNAGSSSMFIVGLLNGLLPCGLVYTALAIALAAGDPLSGALVMILFGGGTFPMMFVLSISRKFISQVVWKKFARWSPLFAMIIGVIFIFRGLNLGIPYLSPHVDAHGEVMECCHPE